MTAKNIALFVDGTWNAPTPFEDTNVRKLFEWSLVPDTPSDPQQVCCYLPGVGEDMAHMSASVNTTARTRPRLDIGRPLRRVLDRVWNAGAGGVGGWGTARRIQEAYRFLCEEYQRGDRIFIFGFSRGAFAARSLAGFVSRVGVLLAHRIDEVGEAYRLYELAPDASQPWLAEHMRRLELRMIQTLEDEDALPIHFMGVWDTVGALGLPRRLSIFSAPFTEHHQVDVPPNVFSARHAMALHELRPDFDLMLWSNTSMHPDLLQVWFPGDHSDVGGGHGQSRAGYADTALHWMAQEASSKGLRLNNHVPQLNRRELHQQSLWFLINSPLIRPEIRELSRFTGPNWDHASYCHCSVENHLSDYTGQGYKFLNAGLNSALTSVDLLAGELMTKAQTRNLVVGLC